MTFFYDLNKKLKQVLEAPKSVHQNLNEGAVAEAGYSAKDARAGKDIGKPGKNFAKIAKGAAERYGSKERGEKVAGAVLNKLRHPKEGIEDRIGDLDQSNPVNQPAYQRKAKSGDSAAAARGMPQKEGVDKVAFAKLAPPTDKITFADKIAGAKKEVDEMLGDVAANAMKAAVTSKGGTVAKTKGGIKHSAGPGVYGGSEKDTHPLDKLKGPSKKKLTGREETDEGWDDMMKDVERRRSTTKKGEITHGHKHDIEDTGHGRRVTRRTDPNTGYSVGADDEESKADAPKRGRGRPKGTGSKMGAKGPSGKSKLMTKEADHDSAEVKQAMAVLKKAGYKVEKAEEELDEKAVSKAQQRFMGMVHATQKGEKAPSKEVAKVAKSMKKSDAEDFAATKHKGLPEKKKPEGKKKEKTEEAGGTGTPTASSGFSFGKGIYDSIDREVEAMIAESMNVSMSMNTDAQGGPSKSLTVTATDDDAVKLAQLLKSAGLGGDGYGGSGYKSACGCGTPDCSCGQEEMDEAYGDTTPTENAPDYPTNTETSHDALQYAGGLNKPKSTGQTTVPVIASQDDRQQSYADMEEDAIKRMMEMAGIKKTVEATIIPGKPGLSSTAILAPGERMVSPELEKVDQVELNKAKADAIRSAGASGTQPDSASSTSGLAAQKGDVIDVDAKEVAEDDLARMKQHAGIKEAESVEEDDVEEGNKFTGNLAKARAAGKKQADLDGDGDMEKVDEGILSATANLWTEYKGKYGV